MIRNELTPVEPQTPAPAPLPEPEPVEPSIYRGRGLAALLPVLAYAEGEGLIVVPVELAELKKQLAAYASRENEILAELYTRFQAYRDKYFPEMEDILISIEPLHNKILAHYQPKNGLKIPHVITFNSTFLALNYQDKNLVELDRDLVGHVLLHEMIHHFQTLAGEVHTSQQSAHGRSFRREAKRVGVEGAGRLMKCPYPVKMPEPVRKAKNDNDTGEGDNDNDNDNGQEECNRPHVTPDMVAAIQKLGKDLKNRRFGFEVFCDKINQIMAGGLPGSALDRPGAGEESEIED